uniref:Secreted protein n=1 Tax=Brassica campestris TaxID=3711 RepID=A0A3P5Z6P8_BRACM|nr:unnamed protein product [Brassica rapa]
MMMMMVVVMTIIIISKINNRVVNFKIKTRGCISLRITGTPRSRLGQGNWRDSLQENQLLLNRRHQTGLRRI